MNHRCLTSGRRPPDLGRGLVHHLLDLAQFKGLGDEVICTQSKPGAEVRALFARGEQYKWSAISFEAQALKQLEAIELWHVDIRNNQVDRIAAQQVESL